MATGLEIVNAAARRIGLISEDEDASDATLANALDSMNRMAAGWASRGVDVSWTATGSGETFPLAAQYEDAFVWLLAQVLSEDFPDLQPPNPFKVKDAWDVMTANFKTTPAMAIDSGLKRMPSQYWGYGNRETL